MRTLKKASLVALGLAVALGALHHGGAAEPNQSLGPNGKQWNQIVDKAFAYLKASQANDVSWRRNASSGVTGVVLTGMLLAAHAEQRNRLLSPRGYLPPIIAFARRASWATELPGLVATQRLH